MIYARLVKNHLKNGLREMKNKIIEKLPQIEVLPNIEEQIIGLIGRGHKLTAPTFAQTFNLSTAGLEKKLKKLESRGLLKSSLERVRSGVSIKTMRVYEKI